MINGRAFNRNNTSPRQRTNENSPALSVLGSRPYRNNESVKRTAESANDEISRPLHGLVRSARPIPTSKSVDYFRTFAGADSQFAHFREDLGVLAEILRFFEDLSRSHMGSFTLRMGSFTLHMESFTLHMGSFTLRMGSFTLRMESFTLQVESFTTPVEHSDASVASLDALDASVASL